MAIVFNCTQCGRKLKAPEDLAGASARCPSCGTVVPVPPVQEQPTPLDRQWVSAAEARQTAPPPSGETARRKVVASAERLGRYLSFERTGRLLRFATAAGLCLVVLTGLILALRMLITSVRLDEWRFFLWFCPESAVFFALAGLAGYLCCRDGLRRIGQTASEVRDRTAPKVIALLTLGGGLALLWAGAMAAVEAKFYALLPLVLGIAAVAVLGAAFWCWPQSVGTKPLPEGDPGRWGAVHTFLGLVDLWARISFLQAVALFCLGTAGAVLTLLIAFVGREVAEGRASFIYAMQEKQAYVVIGVLAVSPLAFYLLYLCVRALTDTVRVWVATEENTRPSD